MNQEPKKGFGTANGKIILMGEHAVVYGEPAIAIPFPAVSIQTTIEQKIGPATLDCTFYRGLLQEAPLRLNSLLTAISETLAVLKKSAVDFSITITSMVPPERGMGSSAAVAVATIRALYDYFNQPLEREQLMHLIDVAETIAHGNPSGLDAAMTSGTTPLYYVKNQAFEAFDLNLNGCLIVADTGITGQTKKAIQLIEEQFITHQAATQQKITQLGTLSKQAKLALSSNDKETLGESMNQAHHLLQQLGVSNSTLDLLVDTAIENGALGAKLTGGGLGGCMIALAETQTDADWIALKLKQNGAKNTWIYQMGANQIEK